MTSHTPPVYGCTWEKPTGRKPYTGFVIYGSQGLSAAHKACRALGMAFPPRNDEELTAMEKKMDAIAKERVV